ncbi:hypothetical protein Bpfe_026463, partial [Biomphalaria pfeifferi]
MRLLRAVIQVYISWYAFPFNVYLIFSVSICPLVGQPVMSVSFSNLSTVNFDFLR